MTTPLQLSMLEEIINSEYQPGRGQGSTPAIEDLDWVWAEMIIETQRDKGTFASLVNAGLAQHNGLDDEDACVRVTPAGLAAYLAGK